MVFLFFGFLFFFSSSFAVHNGVMMVYNKYVQFLKTKHLKCEQMYNDINKIITCTELFDKNIKEKNLCCRIYIYIKIREHIYLFIEYIFIYIYLYYEQ